MSGQEYRYRVVRMNESQRREVLAKLDGVGHSTDRPNRRNAPRLPYRRTHVSIAISQPGGVTIECTVPTRDLSSGGLSFVYWGFLHQNTVCHCALVQADGRLHEVEGEVAWCRHLSGPNHLIGIRFRRSIHAEQFIDRQDRTSSRNRLDPKKIHGRALLICNSRIDRRLMEMHLNRTSIEFICVPTGAQAVDVIGKQSFDVVLCEMDSSPEAGEQALVAMRMVGTQAHFIAITVETDPRRQRRMRDAGAQDILVKPLNEEHIFKALLRALYDGEATDDDSLVLHSMMCGQGIDDLIESFVNEARCAAEEMRHAWDLGDLATLRALAIKLRGTAAGVGFPQLSETATDLIAALDSGRHADPETIAPSVRHLCSLAARLSATCTAA